MWDFVSSWFVPNAYSRLESKSLLIASRDHAPSSPSIGLEDTSAVSLSVDAS